MRAMTHEIRRKIQVCRKNQSDISHLIKDVIIKGEDLSGTIIINFDRLNEDISSCNLSKCIIGEKGKITNLSGSILKGCCFLEAQFLGIVYLRHCDCRNCNFRGCFMPFAEYQYSDFRGSHFCSTTVRLGSIEGLKAKFSPDFHNLLLRTWDVDLDAMIEEIKKVKIQGRLWEKRKEE